MPKKKRGVPQRPMNKFSNKHRVFQNMLRKIWLLILKKGILKWNGNIMTLKNCPPLLKLFIEGQISTKNFVEFLFKDNFCYNNSHYEKTYDKLNIYLAEVSQHDIGQFKYFSEGNQQLVLGKAFMRAFLEFVFSILPLALMITFFGQQDIQELNTKFFNQAAELLKSMNGYSRKDIKNLIRNPSNKKMQRLLQKIVNEIDPEYFDYATRYRNSKESMHNFSQFYSSDIEYPAQWESIKTEKGQIEKLYSKIYNSKFQEYQQIHTRIVQSKAFKEMEDDDQISCLYQAIQFLEELKSNKQFVQKEKKGVSQKTKKVKKNRHKPTGIKKFNLQKIPDDSLNKRKAAKPVRIVEDLIQQPISEVNFANTPLRQKYYRDEFNLFETQNQFGYEFRQGKKQQEGMNKLEKQSIHYESDLEFCEFQEPQNYNRITPSKAKIFSNVYNTDRGRYFEKQQEIHGNQVQQLIPAHIFTMWPASLTQSKLSSIVPNYNQLIHDSSKLLQKNQNSQKLATFDKQKPTNRFELFPNPKSKTLNKKKRKNSFDINFDSNYLMENLNQDIFNPKYDFCDEQI